jgi:hypothetical protein
MEDKKGDEKRRKRRRRGESYFHIQTEVSDELLENRRQNSRYVGRDPKSLLPEYKFEDMKLD